MAHIGTVTSICDFFSFQALWKMSALSVAFVVERDTRIYNKGSLANCGHYKPTLKL